MVPAGVNPAVSSLWSTFGRPREEGLSPTFCDFSRKIAQFRVARKNSLKVACRARSASIAAILQHILRSKMAKSVILQITVCHKAVKGLKWSATQRSAENRPIFAENKVCEADRTSAIIIAERVPLFAREASCSQLQRLLQRSCATREQR